MPGKVSEHLRRNVVGYVAVFLALGLGSAWAATELEKNEVKSKHIGKGQVKNSDLANDAVNSQKVANASLLGDDFAPGQLPAGPQGERGPQGPQGEQGTPGEDATNLFAYVRDNGTAAIGYGSGVAAVEDGGTFAPYTVTFSQSVANCVVLAEAGFGDPMGSASKSAGIPDIDMQTGGPAVVNVGFLSATGGSGVPVDTSFLIAALC